jgi:hypothetical protein
LLNDPFRIRIAAKAGRIEHRQARFRISIHVRSVAARFDRGESMQDVTGQGAVQRSGLLLACLFCAIVWAAVAVGAVALLG